MMTTPRIYLNLTLELRDLEEASDSFTVALSSPEVGESDPISVPYGPRELEDQLDDLERKYIGAADLIDLGQKLTDRLLPPGQVRELFLRAYQKIGQTGGVRLRLLIREPKLAQLPWEYAYLKLHRGEEAVRHFLALNPQISIIRHEALDVPHPDLKDQAGPLKMVAAMANVKGYTKLKLDRERNVIEQAIAGAEGSDIQISWEAFLEETTVDDLKLALQQKPSLFHFAGHGVFTAVATGATGGRDAAIEAEDQQAPEATTSKYGAIVLAADKETHRPHPFPADKLATRLQGAGVRVALLGACHSGRQDGLNAWTGVAPALIERGIPAVVAMQYAVLDDAAIAFNQMFYAALANGLSIDEAVSEGRLAMWESARREDEAEWGVPVLYMRARDGILFPERLADPARETARSQSQLRVEQQLKNLYGDMTGAEVEEMLEGLINVQQQVTTVGQGGKFVGAKIEQMGAGEVGTDQKIDTIEKGGSATGVTIGILKGEQTMYCTNCGHELPAGVKFCSECGHKVPPKQAEVTAKQDVETVEGTATGIVADESALDKGIKASSEQNVGTVKSGGTVTGAVLGSEEGQTFVGGQHQHGDTVEGDQVTGGVKIGNVGGDIRDSTIAGGDVTQNRSVFDQRGQQVGRQTNVAGDMQVQSGDVIHGDKVGGDKVGGDKISVGDISGSTGVAVGRDAQATVNQGLSAEDIATLFAPIHQKIAALPDDPDLDKTELTETVQKIEEEVAKGEEASPKRVERWLKTIALMSEDIFDVATATLINPVAGIATVIKKVATKAREDVTPT